MRLRAQIATWADSIKPEDAIVINPCFNAIVSPNAQQLADDLATAWKNYISPTTNQVRVRMYDLEGTPPVYPAAEKLLNANAAAVTGLPRETACCLSFYSGRNVPRMRGRLYLPICLLGVGISANRPSSTIQTKVAALVPILTGLGGVDVDWCVWSQVDHQTRPVTNWYVDDEFDTVRSRGLRPTTRMVGTTTEDSAPNFLALEPRPLVGDSSEG